MKKFFLLASVAMAALATTFVSCEDEEELSKPDNVLEAEVAIAYDLSSDLLEFADAKFTVIDFSGKTHEVVVTEAGAHTLKYTTSKQDGQVQATFSVQPKADFTPVADKSYELSLTCTASKSITAKDGKMSQLLLDDQLYPEGSRMNKYVLSKEGAVDKAKNQFTIKNNATYTLKNGRFEK